MLLSLSANKTEEGDMKTILIIEDDQTITDSIRDTLEFHDFAVCEAGTGKAGIEILYSNKIDLVLLDIMLPGVDGFETCKKIKSLDRDMPIIMITAKSQESDKLLGFELGADDYITKPFSLKELMARVAAVLKRSTPSTPMEANVTVGESTINLKNYTITRGGRQETLSPREHKILKLFIHHPDEVIDRNRIIDEVWGDEYDPSPRTIDNFILKLRTKIEAEPKQPKHIITIHGAGYKFCR